MNSQIVLYISKILEIWNKSIELFYDTFMVLFVSKGWPGKPLKYYLTQCYKEDRKSYGTREAGGMAC